jgi:hypothetical protein
LWNFEVVTEGMKMTTIIEGENPYAENNIWAGDLAFSIDGVKTTSRVAANTEAIEATYYLRKGAEVILTQENSYRGFRLGGFIVDGNPAESVTISVGNDSKTISTIINVAPETGQYLYHTPDIYGKPYRIPAIAQAFNGDIIAISDYLYTKESSSFVIAYDGYLNRSLGCYTMDISNFMQQLISNVISESDENGVVDVEKFKTDKMLQISRRMFVGPTADALYGFNHQRIIGGDAVEVDGVRNSAPMTLELVYTVVY